MTKQYNLVPAKGQWCSVAGEVTQAWRKIMAAYRWVDDLQSPAGWLPVHRDQLRAQRSVSSVGKTLPFFTTMSHCQYDSLHVGAWHHSRTEKSAATLCRVKIKTTLVWEKTTFLTFPESCSYLIITSSWYFTAFSSLWSINTSCVTTEWRHFASFSVKDIPIFTLF